MFRDGSSPQNCNNRCELNVTTCLAFIKSLSQKKKFISYRPSFNRVLAENVGGHRQRSSQKSSEVIILAGK